jgi:hypothetical protein
MRRILCAALLTCGVIGVNGQERVQLNVSPMISRAPATLKVRVTVERRTENRALTIVADSADYYFSSEVQLEGDASPATHFLDLRNLPGGEYQISAVVRDWKGRDAARAARNVRVMSLAGDQQ